MRCTHSCLKRAWRKHDASPLVCVSFSAFSFCAMLYDTCQLLPTLLEDTAVTCPGVWLWLVVDVARCGAVGVSSSGITTWTAVAALCTGITSLWCWWWSWCTVLMTGLPLVWKTGKSRGIWDSSGQSQGIGKNSAEKQGNVLVLQKLQLLTFST